MQRYLVTVDIADNQLVAGIYVYAENKARAEALTRHALKTATLTIYRKKEA